MNKQPVTQEKQSFLDRISDRWNRLTRHTKRAIGAVALAAVGIAGGASLLVSAEGAPCDPNMGDVCIPNGTDVNGNPTGVTFPDKTVPGETTTTSTTVPVETTTTGATTTTIGEKPSTSVVVSTVASTTVPPTVPAPGNTTPGLTD